MVGSIVCKRCGGSHVQVKAWVDANTNVFCGDTDPISIDDTWCEDCMDHTGLCTKDEYCGDI